MPATISDHAARRMGQRSIPPATIDLLLDYGSTARTCGADSFFFDRAARRRVRRALGETRARRFARLLNTYAVLADDGAVITAA